MKKYISFMIAAFLLCGSLSACSSDTVSTNKNDKIQIVTTIFPIYDWVVNILGENPANAEVTMLLNNGVDFHSYQPTADDMLKISDCDVFIYVGGESDEWVESALAESKNQKQIVINLMDVLGNSVKEEEIVEGMETEEAEEAEEETEYDEHVWLSLRNASAICESIADTLKSLDAANRSVYDRNASFYQDKLRALDGEYEKAVSEAEIQTLLFGDRFPFRYLVDDYGLAYYAAFAGCSAETEASFETIVFLANKVDELGLHAVMTIEGNNHRIGETIIQNTKTKNQMLYTMNSMQGITSNDVQNGVTYLSIMEENLSILKDALQ